ncbi:MAG TPA: hypothetical protein VHD90_19135, partial [Phototrophicaceae bacterium]|nr:hypothetical protein [Phototrophicaceae bacterium]
MPCLFRSIPNAPLVEELVRFNAEVTQMITDEGTAPVHVIADLTKVEHYPNLRDVLNTMRQSSPEKMGWMVVVAESPVMRFFASMIFQMARLRLRIFPTMAQAITFMSEMDDSLGLATKKDS